MVVSKGAPEVLEPFLAHKPAWFVALWCSELHVGVWLGCLEFRVGRAVALDLALALALALVLAVALALAWAEAVAVAVAVALALAPDADAVPIQ